MEFKTSSSFNRTIPTDIGSCSFYMNFDTITNGSYVEDLVSGRLGSVRGTPLPTYTLGRYGSGLGFTGMSGVSNTRLAVDFGSPLPFDINGDVSLSLWVWKGNHSNNHADTGHVIGTNDYSFWIRNNSPTTGSISINMNIVSGAATPDKPVTISTPLDRWDHIAVVKRSWDNGGSCFFYSNGVQRSSINFAGSITSRTHLIQIGGHSGYPQFQYLAYSGLVDEISFFTKALSDLEIQQLYQGGKYYYSDLTANDESINLQNQNSSLNLTHSSEFITQRPNEMSGCVAYFNMDTSGAYIYDSTNTYSGIVVGSFTFANGRLGSSVYAMGDVSKNAGSIVIPSSTNLQLSGAMTLSMWLYPLNFSNRSNPIDKKYGAEFAVTQEPTGRVTFFNGSNASVYTSIQPTTPLTLNRWTHYVVTRQQNFGGNTGSALVYLDGVLRQTNTQIYISGLVSSTDPIRIGYGYVGSNYPGYIDELALFNRALTETEVQQLYQNGYPKFIELKNENKNITLAEV